MMKTLKVKKSIPISLFNYSIVIMIVVSLYKFFFLFDNTKSNLVNGAYGPSTKTVDFFALILIFSLILFNRKKKVPIFFKEILTIQFIILFAAFFTTKDSVFDKWSSYFVLILVYIALLWWMNSYRKINFFIKSMEIAGIITNILLIIQASIVNLGGKFFLHIYMVESGYWYVFRNGLLRITENEVLYLIVYCLSIALIMRIKEQQHTICKVISIINIVTTLINFLYVDQTRMIITIAIAILFISIFINNEKTKKMILIKFFIIIFISIAIGLMWNEIIQIFHFSTTETSFVARIEGYKYFLNKGIENPFIGIGFDANLLSNSQVNSTDVGIIGTFGQFGLIVTIAYIVMLLKLGILAKKNNCFQQKNLVGSRLSIICTMVVWVLSLTTMSMLVYGLLQVFAIVLALIEAIYRLNNKENIKFMKNLRKK